LNNDSVVDGGDLGLMLASWNGPGASDLNGDGTTNGADFGILLSAWGSVDTGVICLRRTAGPTPAFTNLNNAFGNGGPAAGGHPCVSYASTPVILTAPEDSDVRLKEWRVINGRNFSSGNPELIPVFELLMWSDLKDAAANSCNGTLAHIALADPEIQPWGVTSHFTGFGQQPTYEFRFDLESANIVIPAGESRAVLVWQKFDNDSGPWGTMESTYPGPTDFVVCSCVHGSNMTAVNLYPASYWDGVLAVDVTAVPVK
jgi:hypothetical protein